MDELYFRFLIGLIGDDYIAANYQKLLWKLFSREYVWELDLDENRAADGLNLRMLYARSFNINVYDPVAAMSVGIDMNRPCSILEMFVALARKTEDDLMHDPDLGDRSRIWFWQIMQNLGLDVYDDIHWYEDEVDKILDIFLHHRYLSNGAGGAFPVRHPCRDLRKTDLWWQMNAYIQDQYAI